MNIRNGNNITDHIKRLAPIIIMTYTCEPYRFSDDHCDFNKICSIYVLCYGQCQTNYILTRKIITLTDGRKNRFDSHTRASSSAGGLYCIIIAVD